MTEYETVVQPISAAKRVPPLPYRVRRPLLFLDTHPRRPRYFL